MTPANAKQWAELSAAQSERRRIEALEEDVIILRDSFYDMSSWDVDASPESTRRRWRQGINKCLDELTNQALNDVGEILRHEGLLADNAARPSSFEAVMKNPARVRVFAPEAWTQTDFFKIFQGGTHKLKADGVKALSGVSNHFRKASLLYGLAIKILPNLQIDEQELMDKGHTSAINGAELTAVGVVSFGPVTLHALARIITDSGGHPRHIPSAGQFEQSDFQPFKGVNRVRHHLFLQIHPSVHHYGFGKIREWCLHRLWGRFGRSKGRKATTYEAMRVPTAVLPANTYFHSIGNAFGQSFFCPFDKRRELSHRI
ncbi:hypothetical protein ALP72_01324 [Pseudomonas coronafaciens pv. coronafaciens]|nr:hypothetical protein ALP72_01324 [Pseudomonas coronafaciens pv. coronafaciens]